MEHTEATRRFSGLSTEQQIRVLAAFGHNLTVAARDTYEVGAAGVENPERLRDINEIQHRLWAHIASLATSGARRYPDNSLLAIAFTFGDQHLQTQTRQAFEHALKFAA